MALFKPFIKRVSLALRRHIFRSLGLTIITTLVIIFALLNPWFGSQRAKYFVVEYMVGGSDDVEYILKGGINDSNSQAAWISGAERAGLFTASDKSIVDQWSESFSRNDYINQRVPNKKLAAILAARDRAETHQPPFQPIGVEGSASSPSCQQTRPPTGQVYVRADSYLATLVQSGDFLKIMRQDGLGKPVIATVNKVPDMPKSTDLYVNRTQMIDFLAATTPSIAVRVVITGERPNQISEDRYPSDVRISCRRG